jgi:predicted CopG family antitoxin
MGWKTLTLDQEAYGLIKKAKRPRESFGDVVRRVFADDTDLDASLADLMSNPPKVDVALLRRRKKNPTRSARPSRRGHAA